MWLWALQDPSGQTLSVLSGARNRRLSYKRSSTPEATHELDLQHDDADVLEAAVIAGGGGLARLRAFRVEPQADGTDLAVCRYGGLITPLDEQAAAGTVVVTARGPFEVLEGRYTTDLFARDLTPAADIAVDLLDLTEAQDGPTGIIVGDIEVTEPRDATYDPYKRVSDAITDLTDAFDFEVVPLADATGGGVDLGRFDAWVSQGQDRPEAVFGYGAGTLGNCDDAQRKTALPRNRVYVTGAEGQVGSADDVSSQDRFGVWTYVESMSDVIDQTVLDARAEALLSPTPLRVVTFTPNPAAANTPVPWRDYWLGDTARLSVRKGSFTYDGEPRIDTLTIDLDDEGNESGHTITVVAEDA